MHAQRAMPLPLLLLCSACCAPSPQTVSCPPSPLPQAVLPPEPLSCKKTPILNRYFGLSMGDNSLSYIGKRLWKKHWPQAYLQDECHCICGQGEGGAMHTAVPQHLHAHLATQISRLHRFGPVNQPHISHFYKVHSRQRRHCDCGQEPLSRERTHAGLCKVS